MPFPVRGILAASAAVIVSFTVIPLFAQTGAGLLEGTAAFGDWHADHPGTRRLIRPRDIPAPDTAQSARNVVRVVRRTDDEKPIVPNGFEVNQICCAGSRSPDGAESRAPPNTINRPLRPAAAPRFGPEPLSEHPVSTGR
jgi:hypothetical protein